MGDTQRGMSPILHCSVTAPSRADHRRVRMSLALGRPSGDRWRIWQGGRRVATAREPAPRAFALDIHDHDLTAAELAEENLLRERVLDLALDRPAQWPGTEHRIEAAFGGQLLRGLGQLQAHVLDRKSTRLNSSHVAISYAVFCLKKQKKRKPQ